MAIYHMESKIVSRGMGRSVVAASAYMSCSRLYNDYDGIQHDYTKKQGLVWQQVFLPAQAPQEWRDREQLWNAVEAAEKTKDSRLAREIIVALPVELEPDEQIALTSAYISKQFVADGMCADAAIHDTDGHNPHAHILLTMRPLNEDGTWQYKTEKEYLCVKNGEERGFTAAEYKAAQNDGWEKQYLYKVGQKKVYMPPTKADEYGYTRVDKHPKSTRYGRQNPITVRWNSEDQLFSWRTRWADMTNQMLKQEGYEESVDHRSYLVRGIDEQPTVHEGVEARQRERNGFRSEVCELNRQIRADNAMLRELKKQVKQLEKAVQKDIPYLADAMEKLCADMLIFRYQLSHTDESKRNCVKSLEVLLESAKDYAKADRKLREIRKDRKQLIAEKQGLSLIHVFRHKELSARIAEKTEDAEELKARKVSILKRAGLSEDADNTELNQRIASLEKLVQKLDNQHQKFSHLLEETQKKYAVLQEQAAQVNDAELDEARRNAKREHMDCAIKRIQNTFGEKFSVVRMMEVRKDVEKKLMKLSENKKNEITRHLENTR